MFMLLADVRITHYNVKQICVYLDDNGIMREFMQTHEYVVWHSYV